MPRRKRLIIPGMPHHVTQRGTRRQNVFFQSEDYAKYLSLLQGWKYQTGIEIWAYCLMPNHVHLIVMPQSSLGLSKFIGETHRRYARFINRREGWTGHLWQDRFFSTAMNESHLLAATRYVEQNPVRGGLIDQAGNWPWSSARAHLGFYDDPLVTPSPLNNLVTNWQDFISIPSTTAQLKKFRVSTKTGKPIGL